MMADLFGVDGAAIDEALEGLTEDGVKSLIDVEIQHTIGKRKGHAVLEPLHSIHRLLLYEVRCHGHRLTQSLYVRVTVEDLHGKRDVEDALAREEVFLDGLHDELYDVVLGCGLHVVA